MSIAKSTAALLMLVAATGVCAADAPADTSSTRPDVAPTEAVADAPGHCLRETGSRIRSTSGNCGAGRVYEREELERTGGFTLAEQLRNLDPGLSIRGH